MILPCTSSVLERCQVDVRRRCKRWNAVLTVQSVRGCAAAADCSACSHFKALELIVLEYILVILPQILGFLTASVHTEAACAKVSVKEKENSQWHIEKKRTLARKYIQKKLETLKR